MYIKVTLKFHFRMSFDQTTMPVESTFKWDPQTIVGQAIQNETWKNISQPERLRWLAELNSSYNENTFIVKMLDFECFMAVVIRGQYVGAKMIILEDFQRFLNGPIIEGPYNWPNKR